MRGTLDREPGRRSIDADPPGQFRAIAIYDFNLAYSLSNVVTTYSFCSPFHSFIKKSYVFMTLPNVCVCSIRIKRNNKHRSKGMTKRTEGMSPVI
jgi:hypothetical protein